MFTIICDKCKNAIELKEKMFCQECYDKVSIENTALSNALTRMYKICDKLKKEKETKKEKNKVHLCNSCRRSFPSCFLDCDANVIFGDGIGSDNIIACEGYQPIATKP